MSALSGGTSRHLVAGTLPRGKRAIPMRGAGGGGAPPSQVPTPEIVRGLASPAARPYGDHVRRTHDPSGCFARCVRDEQCGRRLPRLVSYINSARGYRLRGWIGDKSKFLEHHCFSGADFAGCVDTQRSTTGRFHMLYGPVSQLPIAMVSKQQYCVSHSTPEAEIVAMHTALHTVTIHMMEH